MDCAASCGFLRVVEWLHMHHNDTCSVVAMDKSAKNGHFEVLRWLHKNRSEGCSFKAIIDAAQSGRLDIVRWLCENRTEGCTRCALQHLIDFPVARSQYVGTPFDPSSVVSVEVLRWLWAHPTSRACDRCSVDSTSGNVRSMAITGAAYHGDFSILEFLYEYFENDSASDGLTDTAARIASSQSHHRTAKWLNGRSPKSQVCGEDSAPLFVCETRNAETPFSREIAQRSPGNIDQLHVTSTNAQHGSDDKVRVYHATFKNLRLS